MRGSVARVQCLHLPSIPLICEGTLLSLIFFKFTGDEMAGVHAPVTRMRRVMGGDPAENPTSDLWDWAAVAEPLPGPLALAPPSPWMDDLPSPAHAGPAQDGAWPPMETRSASASKSTLKTKLRVLEVSHSWDTACLSNPFTMQAMICHLLVYHAVGKRGLEAQVAAPARRPFTGERPHNEPGPDCKPPESSFCFAASGQHQPQPLAGRTHI